MEGFALPIQLPTLIIGVAALIVFIGAVYIVLDRKNRARRIAELRVKYDEMQPTDPEYNTVRALYTAMVLGSIGTPGAFEAAGYGGGSDSGGDGGGGDSGGGD